MLFVNFDKTNVKFVPIYEYMLEECGSKQLSTIFMEDKREIIVLLACSGNLLPPQILHARKTTICHPKFAISHKQGSVVQLFKLEQYWHNDSIHRVLLK